MLNRLIDQPNTPVAVQETAFSIDVLGRYLCNTWDEAVGNGGVAFDAVVIGAGMFGAYCAEKLYRGANLRVLVLEAGSLLVSEHVQNLARIGLNAAGAVRVAADAQDPGTRERVWGSPWRSEVPFPGLAYCLGGRSLYWGGWAPRLTAADLTGWPAAIRDYLGDAPGGQGAYLATEREIGVDPATDYISGALYEALHAKFAAAVGVVPTVDAVNGHDQGAPLAIQAAPPTSGLFSFDKYSSAPLLTEAIREAADAPDWQRRLFLVPRAHVVKLHTDGTRVTRIEARVNGQQRFLDVAPTCAVVLAPGTIEATRLALQSFPTPLMGRNLMAHLRSNTTVRVRRTAFSGLPLRLEAAALLVRGSAHGRRYHLQVTAAAFRSANPEDVMFRMVPDLDLLDRMLANEDADKIVLTLRGLGEMEGSRDDTAPKVTGVSPSWLDLSPDQADEFQMRRAWVNLARTATDSQVWRAMDDAALALALNLAGGNPANIEYFYNKDGSLNAPGAAWHAAPPPPSASNNRDDPANKVRDGLGTTHHEAGTLWMGSDPATAVTDLDGRFHHVANAYVAGPALFPTLGSANPSLTALALARRTAAAIVRRSLPDEPGFVPLGTGGLDGWQMAGTGGFMELGANIIESVGGIGLLWYTRQRFVDFILRVDWRASGPDDNSGIFLRFPALGTGDPANDWRPAVDHGYEVQIDDRGFNPDTNTFGDTLHRTGAIYTLAPSMQIASRPVGAWNTFEIVAQGNDLIVTLNDEPVSQLLGGTRPPQGHIGLQNHHPGSRVQFRNLRIKVL